MFSKIKKRVFDILFPSGTYDRISSIFNMGMLTLIFLNVLVVILETEQILHLRYKVLFYIFDVFSVLIFTVEYFLRLWVCTEDPKFKSPIIGRIRYTLTPMALIDLFAILPFYIPMGALDLRFIRAVRLFRLFRVFKFGRYSRSLTRLGNVLREKKEELVITLFSGLILLIIASSLMYFVENEAQPDSFSSIPSAMWWGAVTLTTVGYGDIYPKTALGKFLGVFIAVLGVGLFALPAGIIASGFASELQSKKPEPVICPHCGKNIADPIDKE